MNTHEQFNAARAAGAREGDIILRQIRAAMAAEGHHTDLHIATPTEAAAILKLRNRAGWWEGDKNALKVLREFAATVRASANDSEKAA